MRTAVLCVLAVFLLSSTCYSSVGVVSEQENAPAKITRSSGSLKGEKGVKVEMADVVETLNGKTGITFADDTKVEVSDHSKLEIDEFVYDPSKPSAGKLALNFAQGTVQYASGAIAKSNPANVGINTPSATVAVRGTDFAATVDETGASTIILLPSCPRGWKDIETDCKTGKIEVITDAGSVALNKPFEGTKVVNRSEAPSKPVVLKLTAAAINNLLIVSPPSEITRALSAAKQTKGSLDANFLDTNFLDNIFLLVNFYASEAEASRVLELDKPIDPYASIHKKFPDWKKDSAVVPNIQPDSVSLCRPDSNSNSQCVYMPPNQNSTVIQNQGSTNIINRVNSGGNTVINLRQN